MSNPDSEDAGTDAGTDPLTELTDATAELTSALCAKFGECHPVALGRMYASVDDCAAKLVEPWLRYALGEGSGETAASRRECAKDVAAFSCGELDREELEGVMPAACAPKGTLELGRPCMANPQCASGLCQRGMTFDGCGQCVDPVADGGPCAFFFDCLPGRHCLAGTCVRAKEAGEECTGSVECHIDLMCQGAKCAPMPKVGQPCSDDGFCDFDFLERYCDETLHVCKAVEDQGESAPCGLEPVPHLCKYPFVCAEPQQECAQPSSIGQPCAWNTGCEQPASCIDGECRTMDPAQCRPPGFPP